MFLKRLATLSVALLLLALMFSIILENNQPAKVNIDTYTFSQDSEFCNKHADSIICENN